MTEEQFIAVLQEIESLLNSKNTEGYFFVLGIRDKENKLIHHPIFKEMNNIDLQNILDTTKIKVNDEFNTSVNPLTISNTKANA